MPPEGLLDAGLRAAAARAPHSIAIRDVVAGEPRERTYAALEREVAAVAGGLARLGLVPGDRAAVLAKNRAEYVACVLALARIGAVAVPLSWRLGPRELAGIVADATAKVVLAEPAFAEVLGAADGRDGPSFVSLDDDAPAGWTSYRELGAGEPRELCEGDGDALLQLYTSGTTGAPKGALLTAANVRAFAATWIRETDLASPNDRVFLGSPLFHVGGLVMTLCTLLAGARVVLRPEFEPGDALDGLTGEQATHALFVPAMLRWMLAERGVRERSFPALRRIVYGASPIPPELLSDALDVFGCGFVQGYGLTETTGALTVLRPEDHDDQARLASAGRCLDCCEIRVVDERGRVVAPGDVGEVLARGANVFAGYWRRPDADREAFADGWFATGDLGRLDADGYLTLVDRKKDMLVVGGENVYPREVELALAEHPLVLEACVIGVPHDVWGEEVLALVVPRPGAELPRAFDRVLIAHCRDRLATFKCPTKVELLDALPRNAAGKVDKRGLREERWRGRERRI